MQELIIKLRSKSHYKKLLNILVLNGLLDIVENELKDGHVNYIQLVADVLIFLNKNKKHYSKFSSDKFDRIIILCIDEILTKKFKLTLDSEQLELVLNLLKNSYLVRNIIKYIKDTFINLYHKIKCKSCIKNVDVVSTRVTQEQDNI